MEQAIPHADRQHTEEEYLRLEAASNVRHEFRGGRIIAMAGGTFEHGAIAVNIGAALVPRLRDGPCITASSDVRVRVAANGEYAYPDLSVVCAEPVFVPADRRHTLLNPRVVVEVVSSTTMTDDLGEKLDAYLTIESLQEYVVVAQDRPWARLFRRGPDGRWGFGPTVRGLDAALPFRSLGVEVPMAEVYAKVRFLPAGDAVVSPAPEPP